MPRRALRPGQPGPQADGPARTTALGHNPVRQRNLFRAKGGGVKAQLFEAAKAAMGGDKYMDTLNKLTAFTKKRKTKLKKSSHKFDWFHESQLLHQRQDDVEKELQAFYTRWQDLYGCEQQQTQAKEEVCGGGTDSGQTGQGQQESTGEASNSSAGSSLLAKLKAKYDKPSTTAEQAYDGEKEEAGSEGEGKSATGRAQSGASKPRSYAASFATAASDLVHDYLQQRSVLQQDRMQLLGQIRASKGLALHLQQLNAQHAAEEEQQRHGQGSSSTASNESTQEEFQQVCAMLDQIITDFSDASVRTLDLLRSQEKVYAGEILRLSATYRSADGGKSAAEIAQAEAALLAEIKTMLKSANASDDGDDGDGGVGSEQIMVEFHDLNAAFQAQVDEVDRQIEEGRARRAEDGWDARDHGTYLKIAKHHFAVGSSRAKLITALRQALPQRTMQDIQAHHELCDTLRIAHAKRKDKLVAWSRAKHTKLASIKQNLEQQRKFAENEEKLAAQAEARAAARSKRAEIVAGIREVIAKRRLEAMGAAERAREEEAEVRAKEEEKRRRAREENRKRIEAHQRVKYEEQQLEALRKAQEAERAREAYEAQANVNKERVAYVIDCFQQEWAAFFICICCASIISASTCHCTGSS